MYRQILISPEQRCYQQIFWRENLPDELSIYQLNTVTYGTALALCLAIRCLRLLAEENSRLFPTESHIIHINNDMYVDDLITGSDNVDDLKIICNNIYAIFKRAGFKLRKWSINTSDIEGGNIILHKSVVQINQKTEHKTLGMNYNPLADTFSYSLSQTIQLAPIVTKKHILKTVAKVFDPLGLLRRVTIIPKLLMQKTKGRETLIGINQFHNQ